MKSTNFLLVGVGGQGTLLASNVLAHVGVRAGFDVKKAEVHGMAQRGGSVSSHIRWGGKTYSPLIAQGEVDYLVSFETLEALRYMRMLRPGGMVLVSQIHIPPLSVSSGGDVYPSDDEVRRIVGEVTDDLHFVSSLCLAEEAGNARAHNMVMLGALASRIAGIAPETWLEVIAELAPAKSIKVNQRAFQMGEQIWRDV